MRLSVSQRAEYYEDPAVRERIAEFFGGPIPDEASAVYFAAGDDERSNHRTRLPLEELPSWLHRGAELNRSLWDRQSLLAHLDIEYVNFDHPGTAYVNAERTFQVQTPVVEAVTAVLNSFGLHPLHLITGRGHHFLWRIGQETQAFGQLARLGHLSSSVRRLYATDLSPAGDLVSPSLGGAFAGLGLVIEFVAHQVKQFAARKSALPIELAAIETGAIGHDREMISVDITEYADPLSMRLTRVPFSVYLKTSQQRASIGTEIADGLPPLFVVPMGNMSIEEAVRVMREPARVRRLAWDSSVMIPCMARPMERLIAAYRQSRLAHFHEQFYSEQHDATGIWKDTYDQVPFEPLPPCVRQLLDQPNDFLLRPGWAQRLVRVMLALGWHPRHIGGLIRSKYERDHGWGDQWHGCDPATRADFYARVFSGLFVTGVDDLVDFNCQSAREEGLCSLQACPDNLERFRNSLLERRNHERLAGRPFHGLFLPTEHL